MYGKRRRKLVEDSKNANVSRGAREKQIERRAENKKRINESRLVKRRSEKDDVTSSSRNERRNEPKEEEELSKPPT